MCGIGGRRYNRIIGSSAITTSQTATQEDEKVKDVENGSKAQVISDDGGSSVRVKVRGVPMGGETKNYHKPIAMDVKRSSQAISDLVQEISKANYIYKKSSARKESISNRMEDIKFLQSLPPGLQN